MDERDTLMTKKEVATFMRVETRTVERWIQMGRLRASVRIGGTVRFRKGDIVSAMDRYEYGDPYTHDPAMG